MPGGNGSTFRRAPWVCFTIRSSHAALGANIAGADVLPVSRCCTPNARRCGSWNACPAALGGSRLTNPQGAR
jgi:hypothetical protein